MSPNKTDFNQTMERIIKPLCKENPTRSLAKDDIFPSQQDVNFDASIKKKWEVYKNKNMNISQKTPKYQDWKLKSKAWMRKMHHKTIEIKLMFFMGLNDIKFTYRKVKWKPALMPKEKKTSLKWSTGKQLCCANFLIKVIITDELWIFNGNNRDTGTFICCSFYRTKESPGRKQWNFSNHLWYRVAYQVKNKGKWQPLHQMSEHRWTLKFWTLFYLIDRKKVWI